MTQENGNRGRLPIRFVFGGAIIISRGEAEFCGIGRWSGSSDKNIPKLITSQDILAVWSESNGCELLRSPEGLDKGPVSAFIELDELGITNGGQVGAGGVELDGTDDRGIGIGVEGDLGPIGVLERGNCNVNLFFG